MHLTGIRRGHIDAARTDVRHNDGRDAGFEVCHGLKVIRWIQRQQQIVRIVRQHIAHERQRVRIVIESITGAYDKGIAYAISQPERRGEMFFWLMLAAIWTRHCPDHKSKAHWC